MAGGLVGPLFSCIIRNQFERLLGGDRYFFTHSSGGCGAGEEGRGLETASKQSVLGRRLAHIICQNSHADSLQENVFRPAAETPALNPSRPCSSYPDLDWDAIVQDITGQKDSSSSKDINGYIARVNNYELRCIFWQQHEQLHNNIFHNCHNTKPQWILS